MNRHRFIAAYKELSKTQDNGQVFMSMIKIGNHYDDPMTLEQQQLITRNVMDFEIRDYYEKFGPDLGTILGESEKSTYCEYGVCYEEDYTQGRKWRISNKEGISVKELEQLMSGIHIKDPQTTIHYVPAFNEVSPSVSVSPSPLPEARSSITRSASNIHVVVYLENEDFPMNKLQYDRWLGTTTEELRSILGWCLELNVSQIESILQKTDLKLRHIVVQSFEQAMILLSVKLPELEYFLMKEVENRLHGRKNEAHHKQSIKFVEDNSSPVIVTRGLYITEDETA